MDSLRRGRRGSATRRSANARSCARVSGRSGRGSMNRSVCRVMMGVAGLTVLSYGHDGAGRVGRCAAAQGISAVREASLRAASRHGPAARAICGSCSGANGGPKRGIGSLIPRGTVFKPIVVAIVSRVHAFGSSLRASLCRLPQTDDECRVPTVRRPSPRRRVVQPALLRRTCASQMMGGATLQPCRENCSWQ